MEEVVSREVYNTVLALAVLPALAFCIWLSWLITNRLMSPEWQQKRRAKQIRRAVAERAALLAEMDNAKTPTVPDDRQHPEGSS